MLIFDDGGFQAANAHIRRITLNLMRHAASCPPDVAVVADRLADNGWDWDTLTKLEAEALFSFVTADTAKAALGEFYADTTTIHDLGRDRGSADREYIDDDGDTHCPLCGHKHIRWGFVVRNDDDGGKLFRCGSSCVVQYGLRVDGEATAEAALKKLNAAISGMQRKATREDWQTDHPDHADDMMIVGLALMLLADHRRWSWDVKRKLRSGSQWWDQTWKAWATSAKATIKYYRKHDFITQTRTAWLYQEGGLSSARTIIQQHAAATNTDPAEAERIATWWRRFFAINPDMNAYQRRRLSACRDQRDDPDRLPAWLSGLVQEVRDRNTAAPPPPPPVGLRPGFYMADDVTDLPF